MIKREKRKVFLFIPLLLFLLCPAYGQTVGVQTLLAPVNTLSIADIDFINTTTPNWLFTIVLTPSSVPMDVRLDLWLAVSLSTDGTFDRAVEYRSRVFTLTGPRTLTNFDLRDPALKEDFRIDAEARQELESTALPSGTMPAGMYAFNVRVTTADGSVVLGGDDERISLSNPATVDLLAPYDGEAVPTSYPLFQWRGEAASWNLAVFQRLPGQSSAEEAAAGIPHLTANVGALSFQYPSGGARALEPGGSYVWYVEGVQTLTGGERRFRSPLRSFTVADGLSTVSPSLLDELERALPSRYQGLIAQLRRDGVSPTGLYRLNGSPITHAELMTILGTLRGNPDAVTTVVTE